MCPWKTALYERQSSVSVLLLEMKENVTLLQPISL